jgi:hypothetical protein
MGRAVPGPGAPRDRATCHSMHARWELTTQLIFANRRFADALCPEREREPVSQSVGLDP